MKLKHRLRRAYFNGFLSRGGEYFCVFCEKRYRRFLSSGSNRPLFDKYEVVGAGKRRNVICPNCFSRHRARLLHLFFRDRTKILTEPSRVLHIAPDPQLARTFLDAESVDYVCGGIDNRALMHLNPQTVDVTDIPFGDDEFDVVICNHVMTYVVDEARAFREMHRVLKPGGFAIPQTPIGLALSETLEMPAGLEVNRENTVKYCGHSGFVRLHGLDYAERIARFGFTVTRHNPFVEKWEPEMWRHALDPREDIYVATKS